MKGPVKNMSLRLTERFPDIRLYIPFLLRVKSTSVSKRCRMTMLAQYTFGIVLIVSMLDPLRNAVATTHATSELQLAPCSNTAHRHTAETRVWRAVLLRLPVSSSFGCRYDYHAKSKELLDVAVKNETYIVLNV